MLTNSQARRLSEAMSREQFWSSDQMRDNIYQIRQMLGLTYMWLGGWAPSELIQEWKHLTRLVSEWNINVK